MSVVIVSTLDALAEQINVEHRDAELHARSAVEHARRAGELLIEAKAQVGHGERWRPCRSCWWAVRPWLARTGSRWFLGELL